MAADESTSVLKRLEESAREMREYSATPAAKQFVELLIALERMYLFDLANVMPEGLLRKQAAVAQVRALRAVLDGSVGNGRI